MKWELLGVAALLLPAAWLASNIALDGVRQELFFAAAAAVACFLTTLAVIPATSSYFLKRGLKGIDLGKKGTPAGQVDIPSALGIVCGAVYMVFIIVTQLVKAKDDLGLLANYNAALLSICFMVLLGFADDVLDLPWRYKLLLPTVASLPLLCTYSGVTTVLLPVHVRPLLWSKELQQLTWLGELVNLLGKGLGLGLQVDPAGAGGLVDLGLLFFVYMGLLAVFATNAINIYAGINGLEAGQSTVIGIAILTANCYELYLGAGPSSPHLFSALLALPFIATSLGLLSYNFYPARVFVGDTYCYFAGMTFAVMGILGHFSKTLLLFFLPQIFNFVYSLPQLFKVYPCPRHRMPDFDSASNRIRPSTFTMQRKAEKEGQQQPAAAASDKQIAGKAQQEQQQSPSDTATGKQHNNMTLINLVLGITGPLHERAAVALLLGLQVLCCVLGLYLRYHVSQYIYFDAAGRQAAGGAAGANALLGGGAASGAIGPGPGALHTEL